MTVPDVSRKPSERIQPAKVEGAPKEPENEMPPGDEKKDKDKGKDGG